MSSSVKFEKETIRNAPIPGGPNVPLERGIERTREVAHDVVHNIGERLTGGETTTGYLQFYLKQLETNPLRTKMLTSGSLAGLQEFLASWIAKDRSRSGSYLSSRVPKMMVYGAFVAAPLGHLLIKILQKTFAGRTSLRAKIIQIIVSNLIVSGLQSHAASPILTTPRSPLSRTQST